MGDRHSEQAARLGNAGRLDGEMDMAVGILGGCGERHGLRQAWRRDVRLAAWRC